MSPPIKESPKPQDLVGISVNNEPLAVAVAKLERKEVDTILAEELRNMRKCLPTGPSKAQQRWVAGIKKSNYVPHSRVKHLTPDQIRKEYGVMSAPHGTILANLLDYCRQSDQPVTSRQIALALDITPKKASQRASQAFRYLKGLTGIGVSQPAKNANASYWIDSSCWSMAKLLNTIRAGESARRIADKQKEIDNTKKSANHFCPENQRAADRADLAKSLYEFMGAKLKEVLGVEVKISGKIEVVFKLEH